MLVIISNFTLRMGKDFKLKTIGNGFGSGFDKTDQDIMEKSEFIKHLDVDSIKIKDGDLYFDIKNCMELFCWCGENLIRMSPPNEEPGIMEYITRTVVCFNNATATVDSCYECFLSKLDNHPSTTYIGGIVKSIDDLPCKGFNGVVC